jgi:succinate-semialdehyde dehydrogenase/glutarate-semialdehyde dehydrogenase
LKSLAVVNPRTGRVDYEIPVNDTAWVAARAAELRAAQAGWQKLPLETRCEILGQWAGAIKRHQRAIVDALCLDTGRYLMAQVETTGCLQRIDYWMRRAPEIMARPQRGTSAQVPTVRYHQNHVPYPLVGVISPWNVPITLALIDAIPALLAGCSVLLKPSEVTPRFVAPLAAATAEVPELAAVLKFITGAADTGKALIDQVDAICFTGSVETGRIVAEHAARQFIPAFLELGGKDAAIVMPSADLDNAATAILRSAAGLTGQACQSLERIYVHLSVFDTLRDRLVERATRIRPNWPDIHQGQLGPFIFQPQADKVRAQIEDAVSNGATVHCGGEIEKLGGGLYCLPTVITGVNHDMALMREETFGPLLPLMPFATVEEAIALANDSNFGLSGAVFTADEAEAEAIAGAMQAGAISVNDASLTAMVNDVEKNSFCLSGMGGSRMGDGGFTRFFRSQAVLFQSAPAASLEAFDESCAALWTE